MKPTRFLATVLLCATPCFAAPRPVDIAMKMTDGKPMTAQAHFFVFGEKGGFRNAVFKEGTYKAALEDGDYSLWLLPDAKAQIPGALWRGLSVKEGAQKWDLTVPLWAAVQGKIVLPDGKPAAKYRVEVQSSTWAPVNTGPYGGVKAGPVSMTFTDMREFKALGAKQSFNWTTTAADGTFTLAGLVPGNYALDVTAPSDATKKQAPKMFTIPFAPALGTDAKKGEPTKIGVWKVPENSWNWLVDSSLHFGAAPTKFDGQGEMKMVGNALRLGEGKDLTGVTWNDPKIPTENYEISFDARRYDGSDFFCGLTFPIGDKHLTWVVGGWGGSVVGLSNVNGFSADENETTQSRDFDLRRWYRLRLVVTKAKVEAWIDDDKIINMPTREKEFSIRWSVEPSRPLGIATWRTSGEIRDMRLRRLDAAEVESIAKAAEEQF